MRNFITPMLFCLLLPHSLSAQEISVLDYGASTAPDPTEAAADTQAFISAINALKTTGGTLIVPGGTYHINQSITIPENNLNCASSGTPSKPIIVRGDGREATLLVAHDSLADGTPMFYLFGNSTLMDVTIHGNWNQNQAKNKACYGLEEDPAGQNCPSITSGVTGLKVVSSNNVVENVSIRYCQKAIDMSFSDYGGAYYNQLSNVFTYYNAYGVFIETPLKDPNDCAMPGDPDCTGCDLQDQSPCGSKFLNHCTEGLNFVNANTFTNLNVNFSRADGIRIDGGNGNTFLGGSVEVNRHGVRILDGFGNSFLGTWIEANLNGQLIQETLTTKTSDGQLGEAPVNGTTLLTNSILGDHISRQEMRANIPAGSDQLELLNVPVSFIPEADENHRGPFYRGKPVVVDGAGQNGALYTWIKDYTVPTIPQGATQLDVTVTLAHPSGASGLLSNTKVRVGTPRPDQNFQIREANDQLFTGDPNFETARIRTVNDLQSVFMKDATFTIKSAHRYFTLKKEGVPSSQYLLQADANKDEIEIPLLKTGVLEADNLRESAALTPSAAGNTFNFNADPALNFIFFKDTLGGNLFRMNTANQNSTFFGQLELSNSLKLSKSGTVRVDDLAAAFEVTDHEDGDVHFTVDTQSDTVRIENNLDLGGTVITGHFHGSQTLSQTIAANSAGQAIVTVTGAAVGDTVTIGLNPVSEMLLVSGLVTGPDEVTVTIYNLEANPTNLSTRTLSVDTWRH